MKPRPGDKKNNWLLIKEHDEYERSESDPAITEEAANSAVTGRSIEEIARAETHVWNSKDTATGKAWYRSDISRAVTRPPPAHKGCPQAFPSTQGLLRIRPRRLPHRASPHLHPSAARYQRN